MADLKPKKSRIKAEMGAKGKIEASVPPVTTDPKTISSDEVISVYARFSEQRDAKNARTLEDILRQLKEMNFYLRVSAEQHGKINDADVKSAIEG